jgi:hypothetical protein
MYSTTSFNIKKFCVFVHITSMFFAWISEQTAIISRYSINWLDFITEEEWLLHGTNWVFKSDGYIFVLKRLKQNLVKLKVITLVTTKKSGFWDAMQKFIRVRKQHATSIFSADDSQKTVNTYLWNQKISTILNSVISQQAAACIRIGCQVQGVS